MYVAPTGGEHAKDRWMDRSVRAAKLAECWKQLDVLESLLRGPFFCGEALSLADFSVYPTILFFTFYMPRVFGWREDAVFHARPRLADWFHEMGAVAATAKVRDELLATVYAKERSGILTEIIAETKDPTYKWVYP